MSAPEFAASVTAAGGGVVHLLVDRDTESYPEFGDRVAVLPEELRAALAAEVEALRAENDAVRSYCQLALEVFLREGIESTPAVGVSDLLMLMERARSG